jgi:eukaryotic-like serine/threonine-protein kinase
MIGSRLGNWRIVKELGRGGMGRVYLADREGGEEGTPSQAAVKVLSAELALDDGFLRRFQREIEALRQLNHSGIVRFYDSGAQDGHYYYVMEYVHGRDFEELMAERGRLPWQEVLDLALQATPALKHAHDRGIIHRDLKPSNLLRGDLPPGEVGYGPVKLTDFGIAHVFARPHLTATGGIIGTAEYLSPEQAAGKPVTKRSDFYSLGVVLYTLLVGRTPFAGDSSVELLHKHRYAQFERPSKLVPEIPPDLEQVVCQLLDKEPANRPPDGMVLNRQLESIRRKLERKQSVTSAITGEGPTRVEDVATRFGGGPGPATLMSELMRQELDRQNRGGAVSRFFHKPLVLATLLVVCVGLIVWGTWPLSAETMYRRGEELMRQEDPSDWDTAFQKYFEPLEEKYPDHQYKDQIQQFRAKVEEHRTQAKAERQAKHDGPMSEAQWFYARGVRLRQEGDEKGAQDVWRKLTIAFQGVPAEEPWVKLAEEKLDHVGAQNEGERRWRAVRSALQRARDLRREEKVAEANAIYDALEKLYADDAKAAEILAEIRRNREP